MTDTISFPSITAQPVSSIAEAVGPSTTADLTTQPIPPNEALHQELSTLSKRERRLRDLVERRIAEKKTAGLPYEPFHPFKRPDPPNQKTDDDLRSPERLRRNKNRLGLRNPSSEDQLPATDFTHDEATGPNTRKKANSKRPGLPANPTPAYLAEVAKPSSLLDPEEAANRRCLLVLDLNETLVYRLKNWIPAALIEANILRWRFVRRPFLGTFLAYLAALPFDVLIWTSAIEKNTGWMVRALGWGTEPTSPLPPLLGLWTREHLGLSRMEFKSNVQTRKDLALVWNAFPKSSSSDVSPHTLGTEPGVGMETKTRVKLKTEAQEEANDVTIDDVSVIRQWNASNTIILDDNPEKAALQPHNHLPISTFKVAPFPHQTPLVSISTGEAQNIDSSLLIIIAALERLRHQSNISHFISNGGLNGISESEGVAVCDALGLVVEPGMDQWVERENVHGP
ncbi:hypothetical protein CROQUDRAFT_725852 [Cronartium quercuum f. sp. fusiforme G11]|uniref:Mitochondrial import inner membrane translocase subunit TIM50 n=1 Tax=Cronartium quercuum f. sp. fusiforme G11 TaxID=708437 RepID=A0A9P6N7F4_9BASI|nr:hypothetical protein CROQUDRAFT_725852 [Cronartium quercuum f. sp. fusiforme G11]